MNSHFKTNEEPSTSWVRCKACGLVFLEYSLIVEAEKETSNSGHLCIDCDPRSGIEACCWLDTVRMER